MIINHKGSVSLDVSEDSVLQATSIFDIDHIVVESLYDEWKGRRGTYFDALERASHYRWVLQEVLSAAGSGLGE
jgi:hypothetical protein